MQIMVSVPETQQLILNTSDGEFLLALASAASDREQLNLETFLLERLNASNNREAMARAWLSLLHKHAGKTPGGGGSSSKRGVVQVGVVVVGRGGGGGEEYYYYYYYY